ncbi:MAG: EamA family transporter [Methylotenera sp.]|nr:EamA family transporter [Oligoflexia bacterium]
MSGVPQAPVAIQVLAQRPLSPRLFWGLILCNVIWSANPTMGKIALESLTPVHAAFMRYLTALVAYGFAHLILKLRGATSAPAFLRPHGPRPGMMFLMLLGLGFAPFCFAPLFQMTGLAQAKAIDNALIVAMEPLMTVFLAWIFLRERLGWLSVLSFMLSLGGFALLTDLSPARLQNGWDAHLWGNLLMLTALAGEAMYSILGRKLISRHSPISVFGSALLLGVICLTLYTVVFEGLPQLQSISPRSWLALLWLGPLGTTATYLFWMVALVNAPVASLALTLFVQPVLGALWGYSFLDERLTWVQWSGGVLILLAVLAQARKSPAHASTSP